MEILAQITIALFYAPALIGAVLMGYAIVQTWREFKHWRGKP